MKYSLGRYVYGLATIASGICALASHNYDALAAVPHRGSLAYIVATIEILAGLAVLWPRTARPGAVAVGTIYFIFSLLAVPLIVQQPLVYNNLGNFFEQFAYVSGALILICVFRSNHPGSNGKIGSDRLLLVRYLCCLVHTGTTFLSL
jgi:uncharacterized membrane protein YphA (DoxX/SURF4 family)